MKVYLKAKFIKKKLIRKNMSQNVFAKRAGVSSGYMSQLIGGSRNPSPKLRKKMLEVFPEHGFDDLFEIVDE